MLELAANSPPATQPVTQGRSHKTNLQDLSPQSQAITEAACLRFRVELSVNKGFPWKAQTEALAKAFFIDKADKAKSVAQKKRFGTNPEYRGSVIEIVRVPITLFGSC
jgi:hypothetical protein